jgi:hypothetical protein
MQISPKEASFSVYRSCSKKRKIATKEPLCPAGLRSLFSIVFCGELGEPYR